MTITISAEDTRSIKALEIAASASQWIKCRTRDGRKAYGIPSQRTPGHYHLTNTAECSCFDFQRRREPCKHVLAVRLHCELVKASAPKPKAKKPGVAPAPAGRPVLTMVRHDDGDFTWERTADVERAARYDAIFGTDEAF
jgi:hypothetical protein